MKIKNLLFLIALAFAAHAYAENDLLIWPQKMNVKVKSSTYGGDSVIVKGFTPDAETGQKFPLVVGNVDAEVIITSEGIFGRAPFGTLTIKNEYSDFDFVFWAFGKNYQLKPGEEATITVTRDLLNKQNQYKTRILSGNLYKPANE